MTDLEGRKKIWDSKLKKDSEFRFKVSVRRNRLLAQWAAEKMGIDDDAIDAYEDEVVKSDLEEAGEEDVIRKLKADFKAKGVDVAEDSIRQKLSACQIDALQQLGAAE